MRNLEEQPENFSGNLLVAKPNLLDPNFHRSVVLLSMHSPQEGAMGVIINRPTGKTLGQQNPSFEFSPLSDIPVFHGGPVATDQLMLAAWRWPSELHSFEMHFGLTENKMEEMLDSVPQLEARCFAGHSGWTAQQLEEEIQQHAWGLSSMRFDLLRKFQGIDLWKRLACLVDPDLRIDVEAPDDPSMN
tara:strand:- start:518 stop:1081 length:564 start_codon:yes stop_codon:yes gene_type:complete